jgi:sodium transport system ATP-binding protein
MIETANLQKRFGEIVAVDGVSFRAPDGAVTGLLGPNGAGKTTTLRMIYGLLPPDAGTVRVDEFDVAADPLGAQSRLGVLPDSHGLYPRLTSREHARYFGRLHGLNGSQLEDRINELITQLGMESIADRRVDGFSHGERTKVSLLRSLVHGPQNVLLDEPTNGLDVASTRAVRALIRRLRQEGKCVLFSSHIMQEVAHLLVVGLELLRETAEFFAETFFFLGSQFERIGGVLFEKLAPFLVRFTEKIAHPFDRAESVFRCQPAAHQVAQGTADAFLLQEVVGQMLEKIFGGGEEHLLGAVPLGVAMYPHDDSTIAQFIWD